MAGLHRLRFLLASLGILAVGFGSAVALTFDGAPGALGWLLRSGERHDRDHRRHMERVALAEGRGHTRRAEAVWR